MTSILVVNYKNPPLLRLCLSSLKRILSANFKYEIIVVDIASSVETRNVVKEFSEVKLLTFKNNVGYTKGVNEGIKASSGNYVLILNPDVVPMSKSIEGLTTYLAANTNTGLVGPCLLNFDGSPQNSCFRYYTPLTILCRRTPFGRTPWGKKVLDKFMMADKKLSEITEAEWLMGSALMVSKKAIEKVGLMDEKLFLYMSDVDWARRFWENGFKVVYYPFSEMYHYHRRKSKGNLGPLDVLVNKESRLHLLDAVKKKKKYGLKGAGLKLSSTREAQK
ncbi:MAG: glycosyltransferase family 2 protein [Candidatus Portnoybacteria bacterium]|nr:glycosyltransferase family 2 protein [Candidatus Portnoybacteria bacterium]